jgi:hypothetical protein
MLDVSEGRSVDSGDGGPQSHHMRTSYKSTVEDIRKQHGTIVMNTVIRERQKKWLRN